MTWVRDYRAEWPNEKRTCWKPAVVSSLDVTKEVAEFLTSLGLPTTYDFYFNFAGFDNLPDWGKSGLRRLGSNGEYPILLEPLGEGSVWSVDAEGDLFLCNTGVSRFARCLLEMRLSQKLALTPMSKGGFYGRVRELAERTLRRMQEIDPDALGVKDSMWTDYCAGLF